MRSSKQVENENALLAAILADGTNLGLERMAHASQGVTKAQLAWIHTWHLREETYRSALGAIINAHHAEPMAAIWGAGATSSSDGQFFRAGRRDNGPNDINAKYGVDPGMLFYTHISDQYGPFYGKVLSATMSEAPHVLDGLLHHGTALTIKEHYTDTGGASDHVFALCHLLGFRFVPRLRDFQDYRLGAIDTPAEYKGIESLFGRLIRIDVIRDHWHEIIRLAASVKAGTVAPSVILKKLGAFPRARAVAVNSAVRGDRGSTRKTGRGTDQGSTRKADPGAEQALRFSRSSHRLPTQRSAKAYDRRRLSSL